MRVAAPGKLILTGAYAVLEGASAIVVAVDRLAMADTRKTARSSSHEVELAFGRDEAPHVDAGPLFAAGLKLGLGSSAAVLVAALACRKARTGADLGAADVRRELFAEARAIHGASQGGGSGADVAASVYGGALRYTLSRIESVALPAGLHVAAYSSGTSARTSDLRDAVDALCTRDPQLHRRCLRELRTGAEVASRAITIDSVEMFLAAAEIARCGLDKLGVAAGVPIVPAAFRTLGASLATSRSVFLPAGAGGGDVGVFLGRSEPSQTFEELALTLGFTRLPLSIDPTGVRVVEQDPS